MKPLFLVCVLSWGVGPSVFAAPKVVPNEAAVAATKVEFFTPARLEALPAVQRAAWDVYLAHSRTMEEAERAQLSAESGAAKPAKAPAAKDFKMKTDWKGDWYKTPEAAQLAGVMMSFQSPSGGWSKAVDYTRGPRTKGMAWTSQGQTFHYTATFDNRATTEQLNFLNEFFAATGRADVKASIERGLDYIFAAQYPNGGWPQTFPLEGGYHDAITYNDNAMTHILELMRAISTNDPKWAWLDAARREKAGVALASGIQCILASQVVQDGKETVWCAQHDPLDLKPVAARIKEPASLSGGESVGIVRFLMDEPAPSPVIVTSIDGALAWFDKVKIVGVDGGTKWARFYDVATNTPLFSGADDGINYPTFEAMAAKNHVGYDYFVTSPRSLVEKDGPKWHKRLEKKNEG